MSDDILADDVLGDAEFDPNAVDGDAFLDDPKEVLGLDIPDELLLEEDDLLEE
jgi:hypothetical protein